MKTLPLPLAGASVQALKLEHALQLQAHDAPVAGSCRPIKAVRRLAAVVLIGLGLGAVAPVASAVSPVIGNELDLRIDLYAKAWGLVNAHRFAELSRLTRQHLIDKTRTPSGLWRLTVIHSGVSAGLYSAIKDPDPEVRLRNLDDKVQRWQRMIPDTPAVPIARASVLIDMAWDARGEDVAAKVPKEAWPKFHRYIQLARVSLEADKHVASVDPAWYSTMIAIAKAQGWPRAEFDKLLEEALAREPLNYGTWFAAAEYLSPRWHGQRGDVEALALAAVKRTEAVEGRSMYARIYWSVYERHGTKFFERSGVNWPRMKESFDDVIARYPESWNINSYAYFACLAKDKDTARLLLKRAEAMPEPRVWAANGMLPTCRTWAGLSREVPTGPPAKSS